MSNGWHSCPKAILKKKKSKVPNDACDHINHLTIYYHPNQISKAIQKKFNYIHCSHLTYHDLLNYVPQTPSMPSVRQTASITFFIVLS